MTKFPTYVIITIFFEIRNIMMMSFPSNYSASRDDVLWKENNQMLGGKIQLTSQERMLNEILMKLKNAEIEEGLRQDENFLPSRNFIAAKESIERSEVFKIIQRLPKGAVLHVHSTAMVSEEYLYSNLTFRPNLYICDVNETLKMQFFDTPNDKCDWKLLSKIRDNDTQVAEALNKRIRSQLSMNVDIPDQAYHNSHVCWTVFEAVFDFIKPFVRYKPIYKEYIYQGLQELYDDRVIYAEIRTKSSQVYDSNGTDLGSMEAIQLFKEVVDQFVEDHPDFIGVKLIYSPGRKSSPSYVARQLNFTKELAIRYPNFVVGFDLVGREDQGLSLHDLVNELKHVDQTVKYVFHAGETNWYGTSVDENLIDAVLLNTARIGHGVAVSKHPVIKDMIKTRNIAVEVLPISNQVLGLVQDLRTHPAATLFAEGFPVVVSNDDPGVWGAKALSFDFYEVFMGVMSQKADLRCLKQLALNSLEYSMLTEDEKSRALDVFTRQWDSAIEEIIRSHNQ